MADDGSERDKKRTIRITKGNIDGLTLPPSGERSMIWDREVKGFGVRVTASGKRTYILRYRMGGRDTPVRTVTIGQHGSPWTPDLARRHASVLLTQVRSGHDIVADRAVEREQAAGAEAAREERLFSVLIEDWFTKHVERGELRSSVDIRGVVDRDMKPALGIMTVDEITKKDITRALNGIGARSGAAANKTHKWLRQFFNWLIDEGEMERSPMAGVKKPFPENSRTRVLSLGELVVLWVAFDAVDEPFRSFYRLLILLGQRLRETSNVLWKELDFEAEEWLLPKARTKAKRDHLVPLSRQAIDLLKAIQPDPQRRVGPILTTNGKVGISGFSKMKESIDDLLAVALAEEDAAAALVGEDFADWVVHDIRRSLATGCQAMEIDLTHTEAVLNHAVVKKISGVTAVYHLYDYYDEKADALERWGELIDKAVALYRAGDVAGVREIDPARRAKVRRRRRRAVE